MEEQGLSLSSAVNEKTALELGKLAGAAGLAVVEARSSDGWIFPLIISTGQCAARLVDVESGRVAWSAQADYKYWSIIPMPPLWAKNKMARAIARELEKQVARLPRK